MNEKEKHELNVIETWKRENEITKTVLGRNRKSLNHHQYKISRQLRKKYEKILNRISFILKKLIIIMILQNDWNKILLDKLAKLLNLKINRKTIIIWQVHNELIELRKTQLLFVARNMTHNLKTTIAQLHMINQFSSNLEV